MLYSNISYAKEQDHSMIMSYIDILKFYINPEIYKVEKDHADGKGQDYIRVNSEFKTHSAYGRATGRMKCSPELEKAIKRSVQKPSSNVLYLRGKDGTEEKLDSDVLGE